MTKLEELDAYTHTVLHQFPRLERHLLCSDMRGATNRMQQRTQRHAVPINDAEPLPKIN